MFVEADRVQIRQYLGYSDTYLQADPRLESAITNVQSIADGGTRPDNSTELLVKSIVVKLQNIDLAIDRLDDQQGGVAVGTIRVDSARELGRLRMKGRMYAHRLARVFDTAVHFDAFGSQPPTDFTDMPGGYGKSGY